MRPSSSASIACIASPAWSGFNRFYQHLRRKTLIAGKSLRTQKKTRHNGRALSHSLQTLAVVMMMVMTVMMSGGRVSRYYGTGKNEESNGSKKQRTQLHGRTPSG